MRKTLVLSLLIVLFFYLFVPVSMKKVRSVDYEEQIRIENAKLEAYRKNYKAAIEREKEQDYKIAGLSEELASIEKNLVKLGRDNKLLEQELSLAKAEYTYTTNMITILEKSIADKEEKMDRILYTLYKNYTLNYTAYLFSSQSLNEILDKTLYLQYLFQANKSYFGNHIEEVKMLEKVNDDNVGKQMKFFDMKSQVDKNIQEYDSLEKKKNQQISSESQTKQMYIQKQDEYEREMARSDALIKELIRKKVEEDRKKKYGMTPFGRIQWPIPGKLSSSFGNRLHPIFGVYRMHTGIDIDAPSGTPIHACTKGTVVFAGWLSGYGNVVIIQHNQTHSTVYAHQRVYFVQEEQAVEMGEVIGEVGSTGWSTDPHLHFEVRINGDPVNPMNYLP
jgi:murein DD-endopeptidase MepM/ murein hydrolase activator NlpD